MLSVCPIQWWVLLDKVPNQLVQVIFRGPHDLRAWIGDEGPCGPRTKVTSLDHFPFYIYRLVIGKEHLNHFLVGRVRIDPSNPSDLHLLNSRVLRACAL